MSNLSPAKEVAGSVGLSTLAAAVAVGGKVCLGSCLPGWVGWGPVGWCDHGVHALRLVSLMSILFIRPVQSLPCRCCLRLCSALPVLVVSLSPSPSHELGSHVQGLKNKNKRGGTRPRKQLWPTTAGSQQALQWICVQCSSFFKVCCDGNPYSVFMRGG